MTISWLPELLYLKDYDGNWSLYVAAVYEAFEKDFVESKPKFMGRRLGLKRYPEYDGKSATFWHMTSEGNNEEERTPDMRRCERIRWPRPCIEKSDEPELLVWTEKQKGSNRVYIWAEAEGYLVVLNDRGKYILPWTAFYVEHEHQRRKYRKRWEKHCKEEK